MKENEPQIGQIVHFYDRYTQSCFASIVVSVSGDEAGLTVFRSPHAQTGESHVLYDSYKTGRGWHWPEDDKRRKIDEDKAI